MVRTIDLVMRWVETFAAETELADATNFDGRRQKTVHRVVIGGVAENAKISLPREKIVLLH